jgi:hypothetical protein
MRNITVCIPDDVYLRARVWAAERDASLSSVVRYLLETLPGIKRSASAFPLAMPNSAPPAPNAATSAPAPSASTPAALASNPANSAF